MMSRYLNSFFIAFALYSSAFGVILYQSTTDNFSDQQTTNENVSRVCFSVINEQTPIVKEEVKLEKKVEKKIVKKEVLQTPNPIAKATREVIKKRGTKTNSKGRGEGSCAKRDQSSSKTEDAKSSKHSGSRVRKCRDVKSKTRQVSLPSSRKNQLQQILPKHGKKKSYRGKCRDEVSSFSGWKRRAYQAHLWQTHI